MGNTLVAVSEALKHNKTLLALNCDGNKTNARMETAFIDLFKKGNTTLLQIILPITNEDTNKTIKDLIQNNRKRAAERLHRAKEKGEQEPYSKEVQQQCPVM